MCSLFQNCIRVQFYLEKTVILLGVNYKAYINYLICMTTLPEIDTFGNAISEANRVDILDLIVQKNEITIKDIEQELGITGTNAYYHLSLMIKANLIQTRNQGRTVLYSINRQYVSSVCKILNKYT